MGLNSSDELNDSFLITVYVSLWLMEIVFRKLHIRKGRRKSVRAETESRGRSRGRTGLSRVWSPFGSSKGTTLRLLDRKVSIPRKRW